MDKGSSEFRGVLPLTDKPLSFGSKTGELVGILKDSFKLQTLLLGGSLLQLVLCATLPLRWAAVPPMALLLNALITTLVQASRRDANAYVSRVIRRRVATQVPGRDGSFGASVADQGLVVFNLGVQANHPLGFLGPGMAAVVPMVEAMVEDLQARRDEYGFLGSSNWRSDGRESNNTLVTTFYFRHVEGLNRFAQEPMHREAWDWYNPKKHHHIGIFHETFCVPEKAYETIFINCHPVLTANISAKKETPEGDRWQNSMVKADIPVLKSQYSRLGSKE